jgi:hypothetical protein
VSGVRAFVLARSSLRQHKLGAGRVESRIEGFCGTSAYDLHDLEEKFMSNRILISVGFLSGVWLIPLEAEELEAFTFNIGGGVSLPLN